MKRIACIGIAVLLTITLGGCILQNGDMIPVTFSLENSSEVTISEIWFHSPPRYGSSSPIHNILTDGDKSLKPGEVREFTISLFNNQIESGGLIYVIPAGTGSGIFAGETYLEDDYLIVISSDDSGNDFFVTIYGDNGSSDDDEHNLPGRIS